MENVPTIGVDGETYDRISGHKEFAYTSDRLPDGVFEGGSVCFECPHGRRFVRRIEEIEPRPPLGTSLRLRNISRS